MKELLIRSLTGIALIALIILSLLFHPLSFLFIFSLACLFSWLEFARMYRERIPVTARILTAAYLCGSVILSFFTASGELAKEWIILPAALLLPLFLLLSLGYTQTRFKQTLGTGLVIIYLLAGYMGLNYLAYSPGHPGYSPRWILFTFYFLWMFDSMAYVSGRLAGKNKVWPSVSPLKTWEGSIGGAIFTFALAILFSRYFSELSVWEWLGYAVIVIVFGSLGDFYESGLKRRAGVKDSGNFLPGHGGILDRFDSLLLSVPFVTIYLYSIL